MTIRTKLIAAGAIQLLVVVGLLFGRFDADSRDKVERQYVRRRAVSS